MHKCTYLFVCPSVRLSVCPENLYVCTGVWTYVKKQLADYAAKECVSIASAPAYTRTRTQTTVISRHAHTHTYTYAAGSIRLSALYFLQQA